MKLFLDLQLRNKLFLLFAVILAMFAIAFWNAYSTTDQLLEAQRRVRDHQSDALAISRMSEARNESRVLMLLLLKTTNEEVDERRSHAAGIREIAVRNAEIRNEIQERNKEDPVMIQRLRQYEAIAQVYSDVREAVINNALAGRMEEAQRISLGEQEQRFRNLRDIGEQIFEQAFAESARAIEESQREALEAKRLYLTLGLVVLAVGWISVWWLGRVISAPLRDVVAAAKRIATGDLRATLTLGERRDEIGELSQAFHRMVENLGSMQREIQEGVNVLATSASEIFSATAEIAAGATETATAVSQTTATAEEVKQTAQVSAQKSGHVADIAQRAAQSAQTGRKAIDESVAGMQHIREQMELIAETVVRLSEQSQAIGEIISSVNDLAEQSNLLAVNAAIEAAKAGEHGKGFAVVAHEIRNLASQSKESTAQIRTILNDIQRATSATVMAAEQGGKAVETGVRQVNQSGEAIRTLAESIVAAAQAATQITASTQEQLIGIDQVAIAIQNILQASKQNATATQQVESGAKNLNQLGQNLKSVAQKFTV